MRASWHRSTSRRAGVVAVCLLRYFPLHGHLSRPCRGRGGGDRARVHAGSACAWHGCKDRVLARLWPGGLRRVPLGRASWRGFWPARLHHFGVSRHAVANGRACSACVMAGMLPARLRLLGLASRFRLLAGASRPWWRFRRCECFPARLRPKAAVDDRPSPPVGFLCVIAGMWPARLRLLGSASRLVEDASSRVLLARLHPKAAVGDRPSPPRWVLVLGRHVCSPG